ncbi:hypothetical protein D9615_007102 [Tricholomella constricta]|uniref:AB hydrolase-1 domain-containing protein n=1 Tax=Tricholomella constricta TaxID=117010 RepID=A0A8H5H8B2_9AGAR|nr:hypothetical protein D9615_007102 [Tricholomella constricta]
MISKRIIAWNYFCITPSLASMSDRHTLSWKAPIITETPLPSPIKRTYIRTPNGLLELLVAQPPSSSSVQPRKKALLFQHGGFGSAAVWIPYLLLFSQTYGHPCYAASLRGHGASWNPGFLRLVFGTGKAAMARDLGYILNFVQGFEAGQRDGDVDPENVVLIGHSAGGGLSQYFLSQGLGQVGGLVLMASFTNFGGLGVYWNWAKLDPWFGIRMYFRDLGHPRSPLSSTTLVHRAFFSPAFPTADVKEFEPYLSEYESLIWPLGMMLPFVNVRNVLRNVLGWGSAASARVLVVAGGKDALMGVVLMQRMAEQFKSGFATLVRRKQLQVGPGLGAGDEQERSGGAVSFTVIEGAGHHIQNDLQWEESAKQILAFVEDL